MLRATTASGVEISIDLLLLPPPQPLAAVRHHQPAAAALVLTCPVCLCASTNCAQSVDCHLPCPPSRLPFEMGSVQTRQHKDPNNSPTTSGCLVSSPALTDSHEIFASPSPLKNMFPPPPPKFLQRFHISSSSPSKTTATA